MFGILLVTLAIVNLVLVYYRERYYLAPMDQSSGSIKENVLLVHSKDGKLKASSVTCSKEGHVVCKKLRVGDLDMSVENPTKNGVVFIDDEKLQVSEKVSCSADGTVTCGKLIVGGVLLYFNKQTPDGPLMYDKDNTWVTVQKDANTKVTTDNDQECKNHIALFAAGSKSTIVPSKIKLDVKVGEQDSDTDNFLTLENDVLKLAPLSNKYFRFADGLPTPDTLSGLIVSYGPKMHELTYSNQLGFDISSMKAAAPGYVLTIGDNKRITASQPNLSCVKMQEGVTWEADRLVLTTSTAGVCSLSAVRLGQTFTTPRINADEYLVVNRNNVLELTPFNIVKAANPDNLSDLQRRFAMFHPSIPNTIVPSRFSFDFDASDSNNVGKIVVLKSENVFGLTNTGDLNMVHVNNASRTSSDLPTLALFDATTKSVKPSTLKLNFDKPWDGSDKMYFWTIHNDEVKLRPVQPQIEVINRHAMEKDRNYLPLIACPNKDDLGQKQLHVKASKLYVDEDGTLVVPDGLMTVNGLAINMKPTREYEDGMYLVYDGSEKAFVPKKPVLGNIGFKTPISSVRKTSHLVLNEGEWDFVDCSEQVRARKQMVGTTSLELTEIPQPVPGLKYGITNEKTCIVFAECVAAWAGGSAEAPAPTVCFYLKFGETSMSRKYYVNVQGTAFRITNYVSIFETIDTTSLAGQDITMMAHVLGDIPSTRGTLKMVVNADKLSDYTSCDISNEDDGAALKSRMYVRFVK